VFDIARTENRLTDQTSASPAMGGPEAAASADAAPTEATVRDALARLTRSDGFRSSPQLQAFLTFIVEATLAGRQDRIKGYTIAVEALGRGDDFDPQIDPIVRVEATRLRRTIDTYYAGPGREDPLRILVPRGSYVPEFRTGPPVEQEPVPVEPVAPPPTVVSAPRPATPAATAPARLPLHVLLAGAAAALVVGFGAWFMLTPAPAPPPPEVTGSGPPARPVPPLAGSGRPLVFVRTFETLGRPPDNNRVPARVVQVRVRDALSHFDDIRVLSGLLPPMHPGDSGSAAPEDLLTRSDYALGGSLDFSQAGKATLSFRLSDVADGTVFWTRQFPDIPLADLNAETLDAVVRQIATVIAQPYGVIRAHHRARGALNDVRFACLATTYDYWRTYEPSTYVAARACLEQVVQRDTTFSLGFAALAQLYLEEFRTGLGRLPGQTPPLDRALAAARRAVELRPEGARAHQALLDVLFHRGEIEASLAAGAKAVELNPFDTDILADYGARLVAAGRYEQGLRHLEDASQLQTTLPPWYRVFRFLGHYMLGAGERADAEARAIDAPSFGLGWAIRLVAAQARGDRDTVAAAKARLIALQPGWKTAPRAELARFFPPGPLLDRLTRDLSAAGLGATN
jgi:tetratricopeptide (TPR) repeat protein